MMDHTFEPGNEINFKRKKYISTEKSVKKTKRSDKEKTPIPIQKQLMKVLVNILSHVPSDLLGIITSYAFSKIYINLTLLSYRHLESSDNIIGLYSDSVSNLYVVEEEKLQRFEHSKEGYVFCHEIPLDILGSFVDDGIVVERFFIFKNSIFILDETQRLYVNKFEMKNQVSVQLFVERTSLRGLNENNVQNLGVDEMFLYIGTESRMFLFQPLSPYHLIHSSKVKALYETEVLDVDEWKFTTECESPNLFIYTMVEGDEEIYVLKKQSIIKERNHLMIERSWSLDASQNMSVFRNILLHHNYLYLVYNFYIQIYPEESTKSEDLLQTLSLNKGVYCNGPIAILKNQLYVSVQAERTKIYVWT